MSIQVRYKRSWCQAFCAERRCCSSAVSGSGCWLMTFLGPSRHGNGAVKKSTHASDAPVARSSKFRHRFRRIRMKKIVSEFRWAVREMDALGLALVEMDLGLSWSTQPKLMLRMDALGLPMARTLGLSWSPDPKLHWWKAPCPLC